MFGRDDFQRMADALALIRGRFLLSINDVPEIREIFSAFRIAPVTTTYSISTKKEAGAARPELLISNFELEG